MKPVLMRHTESSHDSFKIWQNCNPYRHNPWHYHPEFEITYIVRGNGTLFIGNQMVGYEEDMLFIFGPNLPHEFRSNIVENPDLDSESYSVHFDHLFLGEQFYQLSEVHGVNDLLFHASRGILVEDQSTKDCLKLLLIKLYQAKGLARICLLLEMLHVLTQCPNMAYLSSNSFIEFIDRDKDHRINDVFQYVMKNFTSNITVNEAASLVNMTTTSFCRFFKNRTHKSFMEYVTQVRIGYACRLLLEGKLSISQVAYTSGFGNLSHFNKQFKLSEGVTPSQFTKSYLFSS